MEIDDFDLIFQISHINHIKVYVRAERNNNPSALTYAIPHMPSQDMELPRSWISSTISPNQFSSKQNVLLVLVKQKRAAP